MFKKNTYYSKPSYCTSMDSFHQACCHIANEFGFTEVKYKEKPDNVVDFPCYVLSHGPLVLYVNPYYVNFYKKTWCYALQGLLCRPDISIFRLVGTHDYRKYVDFFIDDLKSTMGVFSEIDIEGCVVGSIKRDVRNKFNKQVNIIVYGFPIFPMDLSLMPPKVADCFRQYSKVRFHLSRGKQGYNIKIKSFHD